MELFLCVLEDGFILAEFDVPTPDEDEELELPDSSTILILAMLTGFVFIC